MFDITDSAKNTLEKYFEDQTPSPVRVYLTVG